MDDVQGIDEALYSRQLYVLGQGAMRKLFECDVLISGIGGLGVEVAKNLILAGVRGITLHDRKELKRSELSSQFFASEADIGQNRAGISRNKLAELNGHVTVTCNEGYLTDSEIIKHGAVVLTEASVEESLRIGNLCHDNSIYFLSANVVGVFGQIFCDFGENFEIKDKFSQPPSVAPIAHISRVEQHLLVKLEKDSKASFAENDYIVFEGVKNMEQLNGHQPFCIKEIKNSHLFSIDAIEGLSPFGEGGVVREVRMPEVIHYKSYAESLTNPEYTSTGATNGNLHLAFQALEKFQAKIGHLPRPQSKVDADQFIEFCSNLKNTQNWDIKIDEKLLEIFSMCSSGNLCPMQSIIGSISSQEIIKAITRKFEPIHQWFYFAATEVLPTTYNKLEEEFAPRGGRYDAQVAIFGKKHQEEIMNAKLFMVGVGAIGCEMLKNWAMMGIGSGQKGRVVMTDMDGIERSNLNRQFLFRAEHVGSLKSATASEMVRKLMNAEMRIEAHENRVSEDTENIYNDSFFESIDVIVNALDNIPARLYTADKCIYYGKPLLESGTEGTLCSVQVIIPGMTRSYSRQAQSEDDNIPVCTLKYFPTSVEHTIQWARDDFEGCFKLGIKTLSDYLQDENFLENLRKLGGPQPMEKLKELLEVMEGFQKDESLVLDHENCIRWARIKFEKHFNNQIKQLRNSFPPDAKTKDGLPFWHRLKKCPEPIAFDPNQNLHVDYIFSAANIMASALGLPGIKSKQEAADVASSIKFLSFSPKPNVFIPTTDEEAIEQQKDSFDEEEFEALVKLLTDREALKRTGIKPLCVDFEKDSENNFHVDFITAASNLRATNYSINHVDKLETKRIVGKIIPAIATTTSLVVGLACLELLKILTGQNEIKKFKNWHCQMSSCFIQPTNVGSAKRSKYNDTEFSIWDHFTFDDDVTLKQLIERLKVENNLNVEGVYCGKCSLFSDLTPNSEKKARLEMKVSEAIKNISGSLKPHLKSVRLEISATDENHTPIENLPFIKVKFA